jgi:hypothetical protein
MTGEITASPESRGAIRRLVIRGLKAIAGLVLLLAVGVLVWQAIEARVSHRANRAREALHVGGMCADLVSVAERFANEESAAEARGACTAASGTTVTLNFSSGVSLNYLLTVEVSPEGRIEAVSEVGAW